MTKLINQAYEVLKTIVDRQEKHDALNREIRNLQGDFPTYITAIDEKIEVAIVKLLDDILINAGYWLYECGGKGRITHDDGTEYKIESAEDVRDYALRFADRFNNDCYNNKKMQIMKMLSRHLSKITLLIAILMLSACRHDYQIGCDVSNIPYPLDPAIHCASADCVKQQCKLFCRHHPDECEEVCG